MALVGNHYPTMEGCRIFSPELSNLEILDQTIVKRRLANSCQGPIAPAGFLGPNDNDNLVDHSAWAPKTSACVLPNVVMCIFYLSLNSSIVSAPKESTAQSFICTKFVDGSWKLVVDINSVDIFVSMH